MPEETVKLTGRDVQATAKSLGRFAEGLPPEQKVVVDWLLERAATAPSGEPALTIPLGTRRAIADRFGRALGFGDGSTVAWTATVRIRT